MPTIAAVDSPLLEPDVWPTDASGVLVPDPERVRLFRDLAGGGAVKGGGGGAGPLAKEFPSYLFHFEVQNQIFRIS